MLFISIGVSPFTITKIDQNLMWYSVIESAKLNNLNVYGYLLHLLTELPMLGESLIQNCLTCSCPGLSIPVSANKFHPLLSTAEGDLLYIETTGNAGGSKKL